MLCSCLMHSIIILGSYWIHIWFPQPGVFCCCCTIDESLWLYWQTCSSQWTEIRLIPTSLKSRNARANTHGVVKSPPFGRMLSLLRAPKLSKAVSALPNVHSWSNHDQTSAFPTMCCFTQGSSVSLSSLSPLNLAIDNILLVCTRIHWTLYPYCTYFQSY